MKEQLKELLKQAQITLSESQIEQQLALVGLLDKWNKAYNLTSVRNPKDMLTRHIMDSLAVRQYLQGQRFIDVGTGPGLPGLPLAIAEPDKEFVLLDSLGKRIRFIRQVCHELKLTNVTPVQARVEDYQNEKKFDGVISRAFASLNDMLSWCEHLPSDKGRFYALKGLYPQEELDELPANYKTESIEQINVPGIDASRHIVIISKRS
ncbi:16S rRNA (guanine(527)-N(7))-methyltransferase RsmG [Idiomarina abyssalis]|uniref:Ribosomal RNA small subunit methyltransferase G n=1 Tax=Idiomarina abyssalis TaxID=86102 RepID=A0A8I1GA86_9GAMM|nr:16S rRNA (guanine(527)-N(7))-methyltransferase RsmG [Idiomarina abyssalis]KPD21981.1 16S rRNA methyltransferase [Idiomarina abyssalis]MBJ7266111.1 16S rRNA (guanine(527)-N(7))-methyltransferase RsmG [Idiomarina abyssalis]MBJ7272832.1 16S rRNA (guanine(527)-N(7))-methyltransferase RsmG [Idiomarina abyssalis]MBJ7316250.1 16S rRNA (guanine(527)-N(7))-methyltransferase RsmG [Idiomarina abyssalis]SFT64787.1 16S rRNA m(7)G-527 methyltransferase [Idiomarina abyssalis]